jgi:WD40 repeat protein
MDPFITHFNVPTKGISSLSFHSSGKKFVASSIMGGVLLYTIDKPSRPSAYTGKGFSPIRSLISADGDLVYASAIQGKIGVWPVHHRAPGSFKTAHSSRINDMDMWKHTGVFLTASNDKSVKAWSPKLEFLTSFPGMVSQVNACSCCQTSDVLLTGDNSGNIALWDIRASAVALWKQSLRRTGRNSVCSLDFDHTGVIFCASTEDGQLSVWDRRAPENAIAEPPPAFQTPEVIQSHNAPGGKACFHPKRPLILTAGGDSTPRIFDLGMSALLYSFEGHDRPNVACGWAPSGRVFATADSDGVIIVWKMPRNKVVPTILSRTEQVSIPPYDPPNASLTPDVILYEIEMLNQHVASLNDHLAIQESRLSKVAEQYPSIGGFTTWQC